MNRKEKFKEYGEGYKLTICTGTFFIIVNKNVSPVKASERATSFMRQDKRQHASMTYYLANMIEHPTRSTYVRPGKKLRGIVKFV